MRRLVIIPLLLLFLVTASILPCMQYTVSSLEGAEKCSTVVFRPEIADGTSEEVRLEVYRNEPLAPVLTLRGSTGSTASAEMNTGDYYVIAKTLNRDLGLGYIGHANFEVSKMESITEVHIPLKPKSDHSSSINLVPSLDDIHVPDGCIIVQPSGDKYGMPVMMNPVEIPKSPPQGVRLLKSPKPEPDGYWIYISGTVKLYISHEEEMNLWHPIALVDSEPGATHELSLSYLDESSMTFTSEMEYKGVGGGYDYSKTVTFEVSDVTPTTTSGGSKITRLSEFKHVYQEGQVWFATYDGHFWWWWYGGDFEREFISDWYTLSHDERSYAYQISETRQIYRGEWRVATTKDIRITDTTEYSGSLGFEVGKKDVFGVSAKIEFTNTHTVEAMHRVAWQPPTSHTYLKVYGGNLFDINLRSYTTGGGGGCPLLSVYDGQEYVEEGLLDIHNAEDVIVEHLLFTSPVAINGKYLLRLTEESLHFSEIDKVSLVAILESGRTMILPLTHAVHSRSGNVEHALLLSDDVRSIIYGQGYDGLEVSDYIDLAFASLNSHNSGIRELWFIIEGHNSKTPY
jgi:hypothetical protein